MASGHINKIERYSISAARYFVARGLNVAEAASLGFWPRWFPLRAIPLGVVFLGNYTSARGLDLCGQATKGAWGMSWRQEASKGVEDCEKLGGTVKRVLIPRFPNWHALNP